jgi:hypothetical protein
VEKDHHRLRRSGSAPDTPLPPERAFVVQLRPLNDPRGEVLVGRVEHIASGAVGRFASAAELTTFIARIGRSASPGDPALRRAQGSPERRPRESGAHAAPGNHKERG